ncbi:MAG: gluconolactonase [Terriglobia bacterium]|nr:MAG: gluconolactonase [Terriglobia bacterium]
MTRSLLLAAWCFAALAQDFSRVSIGKIAAGYRFTEGAAWSKEGYVIFSDTPGDQLLKWVPGHAPELFREGAHGPSGNAFDAQGRLYTCETRARRVTRTDKTGRVEVLAERWDGKRLNAPAGIVVSKNGHVYFTDPAFGYQSDHRELDFYGVYHIPLKGPTQVIAKPAGRPHGIAISPNGRVLYVSNADEHNIRAYDLDKNGDVSGERILVSGVAGVPGGMTVDEQGNLYLAANGIAVYSPDGRLLHTIDLREQASGCAFGEADMKSLLVTARGSVYRLRPGEK